jgi:diadenosine tetraphosphate (Ap4A) HIT family hydrolase
MSCPICSWTPDNPDYLLLLETQSWRVCLAPNQSLLGRCVIQLKRHAGDLVNLTETEWLEFLDIIRKVEESLKAAFGPTMFNWSCYMNHAYRESPPNPHVHWWAVPRYDHSVEFGGLRFEDPHFGSPYDHYRVIDIPKESRLEIVEIMKTHLFSLQAKSI